MSGLQIPLMAIAAFALGCVFVAVLNMRWLAPSLAKAADGDPRVSSGILVTPLALAARRVELATEKVYRLAEAGADPRNFEAAAAEWEASRRIFARELERVTGLSARQIAEILVP